MLITYQSKLIERTQLNPDTYLIRFSRPEDNTWTFNAGQYMIMHIPNGEETARRLYSIASAPHETGSLDFIIQIVPGGVAGPFLMGLNIGDELKMQGPAGLFTFKDSPEEVVFAATGTGVAPMIAILKDQLEIQKNTKPFHLLWGMKTCKDLYFFDTLKALEKAHQNFTFHLYLSREDECDMKLGEEDQKYATVNRVTFGLEELLKKHTAESQTDYYLCGSKEVVESLREFMNSKNIPKERVHFEKFT